MWIQMFLNTFIYYSYICLKELSSNAQKSLDQGCPSDGCVLNNALAINTTAVRFSVSRTGPKTWWYLYYIYAFILLLSRIWPFLLFHFKTLSEFCEILCARADQPDASRFSLHGNTRKHKRKGKYKIAEPTLSPWPQRARGLDGWIIQEMGNGISVCFHTVIIIIIIIINYSSFLSFAASEPPLGVVTLLSVRFIIRHAFT